MMRYTNKTETDIFERDLKNSNTLLPPISLQRNLQSIKEDYEDDTSARGELNSLKRDMERTDKLFNTISHNEKQLTE